MLQLKGISKTFNSGSVNELCLFRNFDFTVQDSEFVSVVGSNGSGKSTLLNMICGTVSVDAGQILINGRDISGEKDFIRQRRIGRVYQDPARGTCPGMTILENLSIADNKGKHYNLTGCVNKGKTEVYRNMLRSLKLGLEDKLEVQVGALSGGQRQALALLMAVMAPVDFLILDEHTAALDPKTAETIMELTEKLVKEKQMTAIMVTHNLRHAVKYGSRLVMMQEGSVVLDLVGAEKQRADAEQVMRIFNGIGLEQGRCQTQGSFQI